MSEDNEFLAAAEETSAEVLPDVGDEVLTAETSDEPIEGEGQGEAVGEADEGKPEVIDVNEWGERLVPVKINGVEELVPLSEAANGYQRQADYTRGKQEIARTAALQQALDNPATRADALEWLQKEYGQSQQVEDPGEALTPEARELQQMRQEMQELSAWRANTLLDNTLDRLASKYPDTFDRQAVIDKAAMVGVSSADQLEDVHKMVAYDRLMAQRMAAEEAKTSYADQGKQETARREAAKAALQEDITQGNGINGGSVGSAPTTFDSIEDAFEAAWAASGLG